MKLIVHENLNTFIGFCMNSPNNSLAIWKYNFRNSLKVS